MYACNIWAHDLWPHLQNGLMLVHVLAFFAVITSLWALAPHRSAAAVFTEFTNAGGWSSIGLSVMTGQISAIYSILGMCAHHTLGLMLPSLPCPAIYVRLCVSYLRRVSTGSDATAHMAEEVRDAGLYVPISLFWSFVGNSLMAIVFLITFLFAIDDLDAAINDPTGYPFLYVFKQAMPTAGVNALTIIVLFLISVANVNFGASTARQTFAFARDRGLPFSDWISRVDNVKEIPANAVLLSCLITMTLSLINIGSTTAFNAIVSLQVVSLMFTYVCSLSCVLYQRIRHPELIPTARWSLGRWGVLINLLGLVYASFSFFWSFWPAYTPTTAEDFNWSVLIFVVVFVACLFAYHFQGRRVYQGPVKTVKLG